MLKRVAAFVLLVAGGIAILSLAIGGENMFTEAGVDGEVDRLDAPPEAGNIKIAQGSEAMPGAVRLAIKDRLAVFGSQRQYRRPDGTSLSYPAYEFRALDPILRDDGTYDLRSVTLAFPQPVIDPATGAIVKHDVVNLTADTGNAKLASDADGNFEIDSTQTMRLRNVVITASPGNLGSRPRAAGTGGRVRVRTEELFVESLAESIRLYTQNLSHRVWIGIESGRMPILVSGYGLEANLQRDLENPDPKHKPSSLVLTRDIDIWAMHGDLPWAELDNNPPAGFDRARDSYHLQGGGPFRLVTQRTEAVRFELEKRVRLVGEFSGSQQGGVRGHRVDAHGSKLLMWFRRGVVPGSDPSARYTSAALTELALLSREPSQAVVRVDEHSLYGDEFDVTMDAFGRPDAVVAHGSPSVVVADSSGRAIGRVGGRTIEWSTRGGLGLKVLATAGVDLGAHELSLPVWPEERLVITGPAEFVPEQGVGDHAREAALTRAVAKGGIVVYSMRRYGRPDPFLLLGFGDTELYGRLGGPDSDFVARGNRGFRSLRLPGTGLFDGTLGPASSDPEHVFSFTTARDRIEGKGWLSFEIEADNGKRPRRFSVQFSAAVREQLYWKQNHEGRIASVRGIKSAHLVDDGKDHEELKLYGLPLVLEHERMTARGQTFVRKLDRPWLLEGGSDLAELKIPAESRGGPLELRAKRVEIVPEVGLLGSVEPRAWVLATGRVKAVRRTPERMIRLECDELHYVPRLLSVPGQSLLLDVVGPAASIIGPAVFGGRDGVLLAREHVVAHVIDEFRQGEEPGSALLGQFRAEMFLATADGQNLFMRPAPGTLITARLARKDKGTIDVLGDRCRVYGRHVEVGLGAGVPTTVYLSEELVPGLTAAATKPAPGLPQSRVRVRSVGPLSYDAEVLRFPGPVDVELVEPVPGGERPVDPGFFLHCKKTFEIYVDEGLIAQKRSRRREPRDLFPPFLSGFRASGQVELGFRGLRAYGSELRLDTRSGWLEFEREGDSPVEFSQGEASLWEYWSRVTYNLWSGEMRSGRGRIRVGKLERTAVNTGSLPNRDPR